MKFFRIFLSSVFCLSISACGTHWPGSHLFHINPDPTPTENGKVLQVPDNIKSKPFSQYYILESPTGDTHVSLMPPTIQPPE